MIEEFTLLLLGAALANNLVLDRLLGICPLSAVAERMRVAGAMAAASLVVLPAVSLGAHGLRSLVLVPLDLTHLALPMLVLFIAAIVQGGAGLIWRALPGLEERYAAFLPLFTGNCVVLGAALLTWESPSFFAALATGLGLAGGFALVQMLYAGLQERLAVADVPPRFRGTPIALVTLGLMSMAFAGFAGMGAP